MSAATSWPSVAQQQALATRPKLVLRVLVTARLQGGPFVSIQGNEAFVHPYKDRT
ncbi:MAG: hypothetical protein WKG07_43920 [Hymenobacter sp.]